MDTQITIRVDSKTKEAFNNVANKQGTDTSTVIRTFINDYIHQHTKAELAESIRTYGQTLKELIGLDKAFLLSTELNSLNGTDFLDKLIGESLEVKLPMPIYISSVTEDPGLRLAFFNGLISADYD